MMYRDRVFRNAMMVEIVMEVIGFFADSPLLAEVAVIALATTGILWEIFLAGDRKQRKRACRSR